MPQTAQASVQAKAEAEAKAKVKEEADYCLPRVAMFGMQLREGAVQLASATGTQGGSLTHPCCGTSFSRSRVCLYLHAKLVPNAAQNLLTFVWHFVAFFTHVCT